MCHPAAGLLDMQRGRRLPTVRACFHRRLADAWDMLEQRACQPPMTGLGQVERLNHQERHTASQSYAKSLPHRPSTYSTAICYPTRIDRCAMGDEEQPDATEEGGNDGKAESGKAESEQPQEEDGVKLQEAKPDGKEDVVEVVDDEEADRDQRKKARTEATATNGDAKEAEPGDSKFLVARHLPESAKHRDWFDKFGSTGKVQHVSFFGRGGDPLSAVLEAASPAEAAALVKELNGLDVDGATVDAKLIDQEERSRLLRDRQARSGDRHGRYPDRGPRGPRGAPDRGHRRSRSRRGGGGGGGGGDRRRMDAGRPALTLRGRGGRSLSGRRRGGYGDRPGGDRGRERRGGRGPPPRDRDRDRGGDRGGGGGGGYRLAERRRGDREWEDRRGEGRRRRRHGFSRRPERGDRRRPRGRPDDERRSRPRSVEDPRGRRRRVRGRPRSDSRDEERPEAEPQKRRRVEKVEEPKNDASESECSEDSESSSGEKR
ncbi:unnamed protein product [Symbiodinium natans]|uniref:RRM domain-containing protein n=1 Tax=Symbiodinium natans TaxID=878477 RepID=A0A812QMS1_9DINO|nr:unnamed protein product [Symbiodinium natans]